MKDGMTIDCRFDLSTSLRPLMGACVALMGFLIPSIGWAQQTTESDKQITESKRGKTIVIQKSHEVSSEDETIVIERKTMIILVGPDGKRQQGELDQEPFLSFEFDSDKGWSMGTEGLGFAPDLEVFDRMPPTGNRAKYYLGVQSQPLEPALRVQLGIEHGLIANQVMEGTPAARAGVEQFDILLQANDTELKRVDQLVASVQEAGAKQQPIAFVLLRKGQRHELSVTPLTRPATERKRWLSESEGGAELSKLLDELQFRPGKDESFFDRIGPGLLQPPTDSIHSEEQLEAFKKQLRHLMREIEQAQGSPPIER